MNSEYNNLVQMISNKNNVTYSNMAKKTETLEMGSMSIVANIYDKKFLFKIAGTNPISVDMNNGGIDFGTNGMIKGISDEVGEDSNIAASQKLVHSLSTYQPGDNILFDTSVNPVRVSVNDVMSGISSINGINIPSSTSWYELSYPSFLACKTDGLVEVGRFIDWHLMNTPGVDNNYRMYCSSNQIMTFSGALVLGSSLTINNNMLNGILITNAQQNIAGNRFAYISNTLVLEGGRYFDWHFSTTSGDRTGRTECDSVGNLSHSGNITAVNLKSDNETRLVSCENGVVDLNIRMNGAESNIDLLEGRMDTAESDIIILRADLSTTVDRVGTNELDIDSLNERMNTVEIDITNLENEDVLLDGRVTNCESDIVNLENADITLGGRIGTCENDIINLENADITLGERIGTCESDIVNLDSRVGVCETDIGNCETDISNLDGRVTTLENVGPSSHNGLVNIQGGSSNEYYHLTNSKYNDVVNFNFTDVTNNMNDILLRIMNIGSFGDLWTTFTGGMRLTESASYTVDYAMIKAVNANLNDNKSMTFWLGKDYENNYGGHFGYRHGTTAVGRKIEIGFDRSNPKMTIDGNGDMNIAGKINGVNIKTDSSNPPSRPYFGIVKTDGVMEVGQYLDFHYGTNVGDYDCRMSVDEYGDMKITKQFEAHGLEITSTSGLGTNMLNYISNMFFPVGARIIRSVNSPPGAPYVGTWAMNDVVVGLGGAQQYIYQRTA